MKKAFLILSILFVSIMIAQEQQKIATPLISVSGEGKIKVTPDQVSISLGVENVGKDAQEIKKKNDESIAAIIKTIKKFNIPTTDFQLTNVSLNRNYDYDKKKYSYIASQTITVLLKDMKIYNEFMMSINESGVNNISGLEFKSSKIEMYEKEARKKAMLNAKQKAEDYVSVLNQKIGKAIIISDNSNTYYPQPILYNTKAMAMGDNAGAPETMAAGEITINANVQVSFILD
jgi:uncharacterized protein YggE